MVDKTRTFGHGGLLNFIIVAGKQTALIKAGFHFMRAGFGGQFTFLNADSL